MACGTDWTWGVNHQLALGGIPGVDLGDQDGSASTADGSPFAGSSVQAKTAEINKQAADDSPIIPKSVYAMCPRPLHSVLEEHLLHGGLPDGTLEKFKAWVEDEEDAKNFLAAIASAKPWMEKTVVPPAAPL